MLSMFRELYDYRSMIKNLVRRDIRGRYKGSFLGIMWNMILPLVQIVTYLAVFTAIFKPNIDNYAIYLTTGMILWIYFSDALSEGSSVLISNGDMLKKIYFPRSALPISIVFARLVNFLIMVVLLIAVIILTGYGLKLESLLYFPLLLLLFILFMVGMTAVFSALDVYFRDVQYMITAILMTMVWLTPIMYMRGTTDYPMLDVIITINPMTYFVEFMQSIFYWQTAPSIETLLICTLISVVTLVFGLLIFRHLEKDFAEVL